MLERFLDHGTRRSLTTRYVSLDKVTNQSELKRVACLLIPRDLFYEPFPSRRPYCLIALLANHLHFLQVDIITNYQKVSLKSLKKQTFRVYNPSSVFKTNKGGLNTRKVFSTQIYMIICYKLFNCRCHAFLTVFLFATHLYFCLCSFRTESMSTSVHTWCPSTNAQAPEYSKYFKYHLVPECKIELLYPCVNSGLSTWKKHNRTQAPRLGTRCEYIRSVYSLKPTNFFFFFQRCQ